MGNKLSKQEILEAIEIVKAKGYQIVAEEWGSSDPSNKCACAISCVMLARGHDIHADFDDVSDILDLDYEWLTDFVSGYDNEDPSDEDSSAFILGQEIRKEVGPPLPEREVEEDPDMDDLE